MTPSGGPPDTSTHQEIHVNPLFEEARSAPEGHSEAATLQYGNTAIDPEPLYTPVRRNTSPPPAEVEYRRNSDDPVYDSTNQNNNSFKEMRASWTARENVSKERHDSFRASFFSGSSAPVMVIEDKPVSSSDQAAPQQVEVQESSPQNLVPELQIEDKPLEEARPTEPERQHSVKEITERFATLERQRSNKLDSDHKEAVLAEMRSRFNRQQAED